MVDKFAKKLLRNQAFKDCVSAFLNMVSHLSLGRSNLSVQSAREILENYSPCPVGTCFANNKVDIQYDLQIVIPVYNEEKYVAKCLDSVLSQKTQYHVLVTVIDDGSTDRTGDILRSYESRNFKNGKIEFITQQNGGFSVARNAGFKTIKGRYVSFLDSDDLLMPDAVEIMLTEAYKTDVDILQGNLYNFDNMDSIQEQIEKCPLSGENNIQDTNLLGYAWGKLYKYTVLEHFQFPEGFWFEDTPVKFILSANPIRVASIKAVVYGYRKNPKSISATARFFQKSVDTFWITEQCLKDFQSFHLQYDIRAYEYLLCQSMMNWQRIRKRPKHIREAVFILTDSLIDCYFDGMALQQKHRLKKIESALKNRRFLQFEFLALKQFIKDYK